MSRPSWNLEHSLFYLPSVGITGVSHHDLSHYLPVKRVLRNYATALNETVLQGCHHHPFAFSSTPSYSSRELLNEVPGI